MQNRYNLGFGLGLGLRVIPIFFLSFVLFGCAGMPFRKVCFKNACVRAEIADSDAKRHLGLMFRKYLPENEGMLFIFNREDIHSFWMKNMRVPLDIIWISEEKRVVYAADKVPPCGIQCPSLVPAVKAKYVLEVNSGFVNKFGIKKGEKARF